MRSLLLIPAAAAAVALTGCSLGDDGPRTTQTRALAPFTRIDNHASVDVRLHVGEPQSVRVHAGQKVIGNVHTDVTDGTLRITFPHHGLLGVWRHAADGDHRHIGRGVWPQTGCREQLIAVLHFISSRRLGRAHLSI